MNTRIGIWACAGALVVLIVSLCFIAFRGMNPQDSLWWPIVCVLMPVALFRHYAMSVYFVLLVNTATYALAGFFFEGIRRRFGSHAASNRLGRR